jgi:hypothetical protein
MRAGPVSTSAFGYRPPTSVGPQLLSAAFSDISHVGGLLRRSFSERVGTGALHGDGLVYDNAQQYGSASSNDCDKRKFPIDVHFW